MELSSTELPNPLEHCTPQGSPKGKFTYKVQESYEDFWANTPTEKEPLCVESSD